MAGPTGSSWNTSMVGHARPWRFLGRDTEKPFAGEPRDSCPLRAGTRAVVAGPTGSTWNTSMLGVYLLRNLTHISHTDTLTD